MWADESDLGEHTPLKLVEGKGLCFCAGPGGPPTVWAAGRSLVFMSHKAAQLLFLAPESWVLEWMAELIGLWMVRDFFF